MRKLSILMLLFIFVPLHAHANSTQISSAQVADKIQQNTGNKQILMIYASWCPHCRVIIPDLVTAARASTTSIVAVSMDKKSHTLKKYMNQFGELPFELLIWDQKFSLTQALSKVDINYNSSVPFFALINPDGSVHKQGFLSLDDIKAFI